MNVIRTLAGLGPSRYARGYRFYISARFGRQAEAKQLAILLQDLGYSVTSRWVFQTEAEMADNDPIELQQFAHQDVEDVRAANAFISLSEDETNTWGRGGRHVESGIALERGIPWFVIGPKENLFHYLPSVIHFKTEDDFLVYIEEH